MTETRDILAALREPFPPEVVGKLPRVTCQQCSRGSCGEGHRKSRCGERGRGIRRRGMTARRIRDLSQLAS